MKHLRTSCLVGAFFLALASLPQPAEANMLSEFQQCLKEHPVSERSPCNWFVGQAIERLWGLRDFQNPQVAGQYLTANAIAEAAKTSPCWVHLGNADSETALDTAAKEANNGQPVLAAMSSAGHGHVALILQGSMTYSNSWKANVPNSASFRLDDVKASFVDKPLSFAFGAGRRSSVSLYVRRGIGQDLEGCIPTE